MNPNDATERQSVIDAAQQAAQRFNQSAGAITQVENNADSQTASTVQTINGYLKQIAALNQQYAVDFHASQDAG